MNDADFTRSLRTLASACNERSLPDAALVWAKAAARMRLEESERATRPIRLAEAIIIGVSIAGALVLFPVSIFEKLNPIAFWFSGAVLVGLVAASMLFLKLLFVEE